MEFQITSNRADFEYVMLSNMTNISASVAGAELQGMEKSIEIEKNLSDLSLEVPSKTAFETLRSEHDQLTDKVTELKSAVEENDSQLRQLIFKRTPSFTNGLSVR